MRKPTGGWPLVAVVSLAVAVTLLTFLFLHRTTYDPRRDDMAPPSSNHTHKLLRHIENSPSGFGVSLRETV